MGNNKIEFGKETLMLAEERGNVLREAFINEVERLLKSGAVNSEYHNRTMLYGVALENISDKCLAGDREKQDYKNMKCF